MERSNEFDTVDSIKNPLIYSPVPIAATPQDPTQSRQQMSTGYPSQYGALPPSTSPTGPVSNSMGMYYSTPAAFPPPTAGHYTTGAGSGYTEAPTTYYPTGHSARPDGWGYPAVGAPGMMTGNISRTPRGTSYSFVALPGQVQHKRPRRRYEEIERMYVCGYNGCEKAYGTLNHLNAHVTMQSHGEKRHPDEFKEIRKEWKAKKKAQEVARREQVDRERAASASRSPATTPQMPLPSGPTSNMHTSYPMQNGGGTSYPVPSGFGNNSPYGAPGTSTNSYNASAYGSPVHAGYSNSPYTGNYGAPGSAAGSAVMPSDYSTSTYATGAYPYAYSNDQDPSSSAGSGFGPSPATGHY